MTQLGAPVSGTLAFDLDHVVWTASSRMEHGAPFEATLTLCEGGRDVHAELTTSEIGPAVVPDVSLTEITAQDVLENPACP